MKRILKGTALLLATAVLAASVPVPDFRGYADEMVISISTVEELMELSKACTLELYSEGKTVSLEADLNLSGRDFKPIPVFCGVFEGNNQIGRAHV